MPWFRRNDGRYAYAAPGGDAHRLFRQRGYTELDESAPADLVTVTSEPAEPDRQAVDEAVAEETPASKRRGRKTEPAESSWEEPDTDRG